MINASFFSLDGIDGAGKSTQCRMLADWLRQQGHKVIECADPGGTEIGTTLRTLLLEHRGQMSVACEALLFMASRAQLIAEIIRPALQAGIIVVSDRFFLANVVYQGYGGGLDPARLFDTALFGTEGLEPDLTFVLDLPPSSALTRRKERPDRLESRDASYHEKVCAGFRTEARRRPDARHSGGRDALGRSNSGRHSCGGNPCPGRKSKAMTAGFTSSRTWNGDKRMAHAYLFAGPEGIGKRRFAQELCKTLLCEDRQDQFAACERCPACLLMNAQTHPDFFRIERAPPGSEAPDERKFRWEGNFGLWYGNEFPIDLMREFCGKLNIKSGRGHGRLAIIDDADEFNEESANCFLKTLEEPPPGSVFFLIGTSRDHLMPTILSRCQMIRFAPLPDNVLQEVLRQKGVAAEMMPRLSRLAAGSPGQALSLVDPALWEFRQILLRGLTQPRPDTVALAKAWTQFAEEAGKEAPVQRRRAVQVLRLVQAFLTDALTLSVGGQCAARETTSGDDQVLLQGLCGTVRAGKNSRLARTNARCGIAFGSICSSVARSGSDAGERRVVKRRMKDEG